MAFPTLKKLHKFEIWANCTSVGATPVAAYLYVPYRGTVETVGVITQGAITTADATIAFAVNGTANTAGNVTIPVASAAAGQIATATPTSTIRVNDGDYITLTSSGASGASIAAMYFVILKSTQ